jgi:membrane associated rhomboid family serine protease
MVQTASTTKTIALLLSVLFIAQTALGITLPGIGLCRVATLLHRFAYPWLHNGIIHAACNAWCLLSIVFYYGLTLQRLCLAVLIAVTVPPFLLTAAPAIGFSGVLYAVLGLMAFDVRRRIYWQTYIWISILLGLLLPHMAVGIHAYCFAVGTAIAALNHPFIHRQ